MLSTLDELVTLSVCNFPVIYKGMRILEGKAQSEIIVFIMSR